MLANKVYYICSPLHAQTREGIRSNMDMAKHYCQTLEQAFGCRAIAPHAYLPEFLDDWIPRERPLAMLEGQLLMGWGAGVSVCRGVSSEGMADEIAKAREFGLTVYHFTETENGILIAFYGQKEEDNAVQISGDPIL